MPYGDYDIGGLISSHQESRKSGVIQQVGRITQRAKVLEQENKLQKSELAVHQKREQRRLDGLKKAQEARKSGKSVNNRSSKTTGRTAKKTGK